MRDDVLQLRRERAHNATMLIRVVSDHGRRFFFDPKSGRVALLYVRDSGRVFYLDEWSTEKIYTHKRGHWRGFSHGGTLKGLVEAMRDYVMTGERLHIDWIAPPRNNPSNGNIWGYDAQSAIAVRAAAMELEIIKK